MTDPGPRSAPPATCDLCDCNDADFDEAGHCPRRVPGYDPVGEAEQLLGDSTVDVPELLDGNGRPVRVLITAAEIADRVKRDTLQEMSRDIRARARQRPFAVQWGGRTGEAFDPAKPEPKPRVLRYAPDLDHPLAAGGRFVFTPGFHILFGPKSVLKTWICAKAMLKKARHEGAVALFIDYEDTYDEFFRRLHTLGATREERARVVYVRPPGPLTDDGHEELIKRFQDLGQDPAVTALDSIGQGVAAYGLDDNASGGNGVGTFIEDTPMWLKRQWPDATHLGIDHLPKGVNPDTATDPLGSGRKGFAADGLWSVAALGQKPSRNTFGKVRTTCRKDRRGWFDDNQPVFDVSFGGGKPFDLSGDLAEMHVNLTHMKDSDFTADELATVVLLARHVVDNPAVRVEQARLDLGLNAKVFGDLKDKMVTNEVLIHPNRKGLSPGPGLVHFLTFARLFGIDPEAADQNG